MLFTDLVGFTTLAEDRDPEAVRELLSSYFEKATGIVQLHGGTVEKFIGDAVMAVWGTPVAHEDDAERAVRAALELVDAVKALHPDLQARAGVLTGEAAVTLNATNQGMVAGDLVNTAARLQGVADPGTVLVGEATRRAAEGAVVFEALGDHSLKGKTAPVPAWRALRVVANRGGQGRADALEPPFIGREEELRELKDVLHAVGRDRRVRLVSVTGPARHRQEPAGLGAGEVRRRRGGGHLLAPRPLAVVRGGDRASGRSARWSAAAADLTEDADEPTTRAAVASHPRRVRARRERTRAHRSGAPDAAGGRGGPARRARRALPGLAPLLRADRGAGHDRARLRGPPMGRYRACSTSSSTCSTGRATCRSWS